MPAKITLTVCQGPLVGRELVFDEMTTCVIGRATDCGLKLPAPDPRQTISRHHCLLHINPPGLRIRDLDSLNGTYVNGHRITSPQEAGADFPVDHDLCHGDEVRVGDTVLKIAVSAPAVCAHCGTEIEESARGAAQGEPGYFLCHACNQGFGTTKRQKAPAPGEKRCAHCGRDVTAEVGLMRASEYVCSRCQEKPLDVLSDLLRPAREKSPAIPEIEGYVVERLLGAGGMGAVYEARHERTGEHVALKVMLPRVAIDKRAQEVFLREMENTEALRHRNVVEFRHSGCARGTFFLVIEYCAGGSVAGLMKKRGGKLPFDEALAIFWNVLDGLDYAHHAKIPRVKRKDGTYGPAVGLVHRDLSPHNILLADVDGATVARISDYGLSKAYQTAGLSGVTCSGSYSGKPQFMPRQQLINFRTAGPEVDVWAAAACLYTMLTGTPVRNFPHGRDACSVVLDTEPVPLQRRAPALPKRLAEVIDLALIDTPSLHFRSARDLRTALEEVL